MGPKGADRPKSFGNSSARRFLVLNCPSLSPFPRRRKRQKNLARWCRKGRDHFGQARRRSIPGPVSNAHDRLFCSRGRWEIPFHSSGTRNRGVPVCRNSSFFQSGPFPVRFFLPIIWPSATKVSAVRTTGRGARVRISEDTQHTRFTTSELSGRLVGCCNWVSRLKRMGPQRSPPPFSTASPAAGPRRPLGGLDLNFFKPI